MMFGATTSSSKSNSNSTTACVDVNKYLSVLLDGDSSEDDSYAGDSKESRSESTSNDYSSSKKKSEKPFVVLRTDDLPQFESLSSDSDEVFLSVCWKKGLLGAAAYSMESSELSVLHDIVDVNPDFNLTITLFNQVQPKKVISNASSSLKFINMLKTLVNGEISPGHDLAEQKRLILLPGKEYVYHACRRRILSTEFPGSQGDMSADERTWYIQSMFNLQSESMVLALGMLLKCLEKSFVHLNLEPNAKKTLITAVTHVNLKDLVNMDSETFRALQIFNPISHPSNFIKGMAKSNKEGLSIFGIFNRCRTVAGTKYMRTMLLRPSHDIEVLNNRLDVVQFCCNPKHDEMVKCLGDHLKCVKSINKVMTRLIAARATLKEWKTLHKTLYHCISLGELCQRISTHAKLFEEIASCNKDIMYHIVHCIDSIIDFTESEKLNKVCVKSGLDEELDKKKYKYSLLHEVMSNMARAELQNLPPCAEECSVVYIPEIGFLLAIPQWKSDLTEEEVQIPGLTLMFTAADTLHYKSARTRELDEEVGDCVVEISRHESQIILQLVQFIQEHLPLLQDMISLTAQLDCSISLATVAMENNYVRPILTESRVINIEKGRHPLQELCVSDFVPNDTLSGGDEDIHGLMKVLTGPNACGKSVYLKQVALIVYLAHVGSFIPAASATIGIMDHIHTRIQTIESVATQISAFAIDVKQMVLCLYSSTPNSLIIIDEFGKGTSEESGLALLTACLQHFLNRESLCPHVFISTHFHRIVTLLSETSLCSYQTLEYMLDDNDCIVYLYKLKDGNVTSSLAVKVLQSLKVEKDSIKKANEFLEAMSSDKLVTIDPSSRRAAQMNMRREIASNFLSSSFDFQGLEELTCLLEKYKNISLIQK